MELYSLPRVLHCGSDGSLSSLLHPFPAIAMRQSSIGDHDECIIKVGNVDIGIFGEIVCLDGATYQNRNLLATEFLLRVLWINPVIRQVQLAVPHPSGLDRVHGDIPLNCTYIFRKQDVFSSGFRMYAFLRYIGLCYNKLTTNSSMMLSTKFWDSHLIKYIFNFLSFLNACILCLAIATYPSFLVWRMPALTLQRESKEEEKN